MPEFAQVTDSLPPLLTVVWNNGGHIKYTISKCIFDLNLVAFSLELNSDLCLRADDKSGLVYVMISKNILMWYFIGMDLDHTQILQSSHSVMYMVM